MVESLYDDDFFSLTWDAERRLARFTRKGRPFGDVAEAKRLYAAMLATRAKAQRPGLRLLIDQRLVVGNNAPEYEALIFDFTPKFIAGVDRAAFLVRSVIGKLQIERLVREGKGPPAAVFLDEAEALAHLGL
jgi:hypothetical protein